MQHAEAREHVFRPEPQRARLPGMELRSGLSHHHQVRDRRSGGFEQRQRLALGIVGIEALRLAGGPAARGLVAGEYRAQR